MKNNGFKQLLVITVIAVMLGLVANAINPNGIPIVMEKNIYKTDTLSGKNEAVNSLLAGTFRNDPYDTSSNKPKHLLNDKLPGKEGYIEPENISTSLAKMLYDRNALFIDARQPAEYDAGHIKGAINITYEEFYPKHFYEKKALMKKYNKDGIIVVYCNGGKCEVSIDLAYDLARLGFNGVNIYRGGFTEWKSAGYPIEP